MTIYEAWALIEPYKGKIFIGILIVLSYFIEISKIKLNPLSFVKSIISKLVKHMGNALTEGIRTDLNEFKTQYNTAIQEHIDGYENLISKIDELSESNKELTTSNNELKEKVEYVSDELISVAGKLDNHVAESMRSDILDFQNSCLNGRKHTKEEFTYIYKLCDKYKRHIEDNNLDNSEAEDAIAYIRKVYRTCLDNGAFVIKGDIAKGE